jgi:transcriptional regulator with XRE-family HTH domain
VVRFATDLRAARQRAGMSQRQLAAAAGTSQAAVSAYESGRKQPTVDVASRLLEACGTELRAVPLTGGRTWAELERNGRILAQVLELAELLPFRRSPTLTFPRLPTP